MIRLAEPRDAEAIHAIYAPVVRDTAISFEWAVPTVDEMAARLEAVRSSGYPWLVVERVGAVAGYAYASAFRTRRAYDWSAEVSVYVDPTHHGVGFGRWLYGSLLEILELQGYRSAYGVATAPNPSSEALHRSMGFEQVGYLPRVGYKFERWHDVIYWHLALGPEEGVPDAIRPLAEVMAAATLLRESGPEPPSRGT